VLGSRCARFVPVSPHRYVPVVAQELAAHQGGVLTRAQLIGLGLSSSAVNRAQRRWTRLGSGVYWLAPPLQRPPFHVRVWAGVLQGGDGARAGFGTAAVLQGLAHVDEISSTWWRSTLGLADDRVCIITPHDRRPGGGIAFVRELPGERLPSRAAEPARTQVEDTALDLAARGSRVQVVTWNTRAVQRRLTTTQRLAQRLAERPHLRHRRVMLDLLTEVADGATSPLEINAVRAVLRPHRLPTPELQMQVGPALIDVGYRQYGVLIELDGQLGHLEGGRHRDRRRDNRHVLLGARTLRFGWEDVVGDPCGVAHQIAVLLRAQGWRGELTRCPRCPPQALGV
jgi:very-short-patch-repair endonuclease